MEAKKLVIANRGEIARRILRAGRERGYRIAVISVAEDRDALVRREADAVLEVRSFLDAGAIVEQARRWAADFVHPGYGFLAENAEFAAAVEGGGITFVGPTAESMRALGNKESAKRIAGRRGIPVLPALLSSELAQDKSEEWKRALAAKGIEPPFLVKAAGGGGGRGMRVVEDAEKLPAAVRRASEEARAGFGDPTVFVERYLERPRHIEIQIIGDGKGGGVFLGERECSMQRRYQKLVEESPSAIIDRALREAMGRAALALVQEVHYRGAGTVEFLMDPSGRYFLLEMNTRLQVEHPVTELVYGVDLVHAQLDLAEGVWPRDLPDPTSFHVLEPRGVAVEARVLAEDPRNGFLPTPGPLVLYREPSGGGVRVDSGVTEGGRVNAAFDSMVAKVIAFGRDREDALGRLSEALEDTVLHGCTSNLPFLQALVRHPDVRAGREHTRWIEDHLDELNGSLLPRSLEERLQSRGFREKLSLALSGGPAGRLPVFAKRFVSQSAPRVRVGSELERSAIELRPSAESGRFRLDGEGLAEALGREGEESFRYSPRLRDARSRAAYDGKRLSLAVHASRISLSEMALSLFGETLILICPRHLPRHGLDVSAASGEVRAPMAGKVIEILVEEGDPVEEGQLVFVVESMKIQLEIQSPANGRVKEIRVAPGQVLAGPEVMAILE